MSLNALNDYIQRLEALPEDALEKPITHYDLLAVLWAIVEAIEGK